MNDGHTRIDEMLSHQKIQNDFLHTLINLRVEHLDEVKSHEFDEIDKEEYIDISVNCIDYTYCDNSEIGVIHEQGRTNKESTPILGLSNEVHRDNEELIITQINHKKMEKFDYP